MNENFKSMLEAFKNAGVDVNNAEFSITEYSLNTHLSFKFNNVQEFLDFLNLDGKAGAELEEKINNTLVEKGINPQTPFYVNFFSPKVAEL
ncbi:MAG: hypothetical protein IE909_15615 [Campylobacterales bacterium]|nr:hypothetical protein [Campylobacterales bacterium]